MDMNAVLAAAIGAGIGAALVQIAQRPARHAVLSRLALVMTALATLIEQVTKGGGNSHSAHNIIFAVVLVLLTSALIFLIMSQRSKLRGDDTHF